MNLGGAGGPADSVASGAAAQKDDHIPRIRCLPDHVLPGRRSHNRADLHALCHIARMVNLLHISGCQAHLVPVGGIPLGRLVYDLSLGKLAF